MFTPQDCQANVELFLLVDKCQSKKLFRQALILAYLNDVRYYITVSFKYTTVSD